MLSQEEKETEGERAKRASETETTHTQTKLTCTCIPKILDATTHFILPMKAQKVQNRLYVVMLTAHVGKAVYHKIIKSKNNFFNS